MIPKDVVAVTETSADGKHVKVSKIKIVEGEMELGEEIGWTLATNLKEGCADFYSLTTGPMKRVLMPAGEEVSTLEDQTTSMDRRLI